MRIEARNLEPHGFARLAGGFNFRPNRARFGILDPDISLAGPEFKWCEICFCGHNNFSQVREGRNPPLDLSGYAKPLVDIAPNIAAKL